MTTPRDPGEVPGRLSLREAINLADVYAGAGRSADITFAPGLKGATVTLTQGPLYLTGSGSATVTVDGGHTITISGNGVDTVFVVDAGASAVFTGLAITHGGSSGIQNNGTLTVQSCTLDGNTASGNGGAIINGGTLTVVNSTLSGNAASGDGGAIANSGTLNVQSCTISGNTAEAGGGIANTGALRLADSIVAGNTATGPSPDISGSITIDAGNNLLGSALDTGSSPSTDIFTNTPGLAPMGNNGGGLPTMALLPGSPALGTGTVAGCRPQTSAAPHDGTTATAGRWWTSARSRAVGRADEQRRDDQRVSKRAIGSAFCRASRRSAVLRLNRRGSRSAVTSRHASGIDTGAPGIGRRT